MRWYKIDVDGQTEFFKADDDRSAALRANFKWKDANKIRILTPETIVLEDYYAQIVLYCKLWFEQTDPITDISKILSIRNKVKPEDICTDYIFRVLVEIMFEICNKNIIKYELFNERLFHTLDEINIKYSKEDLINKIIYVIAGQNVNKHIDDIKTKNISIAIIDLPEPDFTLLPAQNREVI